MAYVQADLDALNRAIATGASRVELPSVGTVTYRTMDEMLRVKTIIQAALNAQAGTPSVRRVKIYATKDL